MVSSLLLFPNPIECKYTLRGVTFEHQDCVDDLYESDRNNDLKVDEEEYVEFISTRSRGAIDVGEYSNLPFPLISNFVYGSCFCFFVLKIQNCCVGLEAGININPDTSPFIEDNLVTVCRTVDSAIGNQIGTFSPTMAQTEITPSPTSGGSSEGYPTMWPTNITSEQPSGSPTVEPTIQLSGAPSGFPTYRDSETPSSEPTNQPTPTPTTTPTVTPTSTETTNIPTNTPTLPPSITTTNPAGLVPEILICLSFQYGIENDEGLTADDIENGFNNTFKSDLLIATRDITIKVVNEAFPQDQEKRTLRRDDAIRWSKIFEDNPLLGVATISRFHIDDRSSSENTQGRRREVFLPSNPEEQTGTVKINGDNNNSLVNNRRLAFYSDSHQPSILSITDNNFCFTSSDEEEEELNCSIVETEVCVVLEEGDDEEEVKDQLLDGFRSSFQDGSFEDALPSKEELF